MDPKITPEMFDQIVKVRENYRDAARKAAERRSLPTRSAHDELVDHFQRSIFEGLGIDPDMLEPASESRTQPPDPSILQRMIGDLLERAENAIAGPSKTSPKKAVEETQTVSIIEDPARIIDL